MQDTTTMAAADTTTTAAAEVTTTTASAADTTTTVAAVPTTTTAAAADTTTTVAAADTTTTVAAADTTTTAAAGDTTTSGQGSCTDHGGLGEDKDHACSAIPTYCKLSCKRSPTTGLSECNFVTVDEEGVETDGGTEDDFKDNSSLTLIYSSGGVRRSHGGQPGNVRLHDAELHHVWGGLRKI